MPTRPNKWAVGIISTPRPKYGTLERCEASLAATGFDEPSIFVDMPKHGSWYNWFRSLQSLLCQDCDTILLVEDDAVFCKGLRSYLESTIWIDDDSALFSSYSNGRYGSDPKMPTGWSEKNRGHFLVGSLCWAIPRQSAEAIVRDLAYSRNGRRGIDLRVGLWALDTGRSVWYHKPSLVQHTGNGNSALTPKADKTNDKLWSACDFIGENETPTQSRSEPC